MRQCRAAPAAAGASACSARSQFRRRPCRSPRVRRRNSSRMFRLRSRPSPTASRRRRRRTSTRRHIGQSPFDAASVTTRVVDHQVVGLAGGPIASRRDGVPAGGGPGWRRRWRASASAQLPQPADRPRPPAHSMIDRFAASFVFDPQRRPADGGLGWRPAARALRARRWSSSPSRPRRPRACRRPAAAGRPAGDRRPSAAAPAAASGPRSDLVLDRRDRLGQYQAQLHRSCSPVWFAYFGFSRESTGRRSSSSVVRA